MRMSCNGCRVLRKGCSESCSIRPCLQWIKSPEAQAHATVFLAKFYGRAGLVNLINAGPDHLRPAIFRSLLYEACGRILNPIYGSVGLLWSNSWHLCEAAVQSILKGESVTQIPSDTAAAACNPVPPLKAYDIRHVSREADAATSKPTADLHRVRGSRTRFKRTGAKRPVHDPVESSGSHVTEQDESMGSHVSQNVPGEEESDVALDLTLGLEPAGWLSHPVRSEPETRHEEDTCHLDLALELRARP